MTRKTRGHAARSRATAAGLALILAGIGGCGANETGEAREDGVVILAASDVATARTERVSTGVSLTGSLVPYQRVEVKAQVPGVVTSVAVDRGQSVQAGALLARIEAEGITSQAAGARSGVAAAQAALALAERQLESARTLYEAGAMSEIEFRSAQAQYEAAQAQLAAAQAQAAGAVEQAQRTAVTAPISGQISSRSVNQGEAVNPGQTLFEIVNSAFLELEGQVPVDRAVRVTEGQRVVFTVDAYPGRQFEGTVSRVAPIADPGTRQVAVVLRLPNENRELIGGLFATGKVITEDEVEAVVVPVAAVRGTTSSPYVLTVDDGVVTRRQVSLGVRDDARGIVAVTSGLRDGEQVIVAPGEVPEGARVASGPSAANVSAGVGAL